MNEESGSLLSRAVAVMIVILLLTGITIFLALNWFNETDLQGTVTLIGNSPAGEPYFKLDGNQQGYSCPNFQVSNLRIGEVIHFQQAHLWPFDASCQVTVIQP